MVNLLIDEDLLRTLACEDEQGDSIPDIVADNLVCQTIAEPNLRLLGQYCDEKVQLNAPAIFLRSLAKAGSADELHSILRRTTVETLAHEVGHWQLEKRYPRLVYLDRTLYAILGRGLQIILTVLMALLISLVFYSWRESLGVVGGLLVAGLLVSFLEALVIYGPRLRGAVIYRVIWTERFARRFAKRVHSDPRWRAVCQVSMNSRV